MTPKTKRVSNHIFNMRRNRRLLQKQLATLVGHRYTNMISKYEHGLRLPTLETALLLEIALGVRLPELYPDLYQHLQALVLKRSRVLTPDVRRSIRGRLLGKDDHEHTGPGGSLARELPPG
jgi:transcriptional regulator with XRE-family HTH domain